MIHDIRFNIRWNVYFSTSDRVKFTYFDYMTKSCLSDREWRVSLLLLFKDENFKQHMTKSINK